MAQISIRREDKGPWEARTPLVPEDVAALSRDHGITFTIQSSTQRAFDDEQYRAAGSTIADSLNDCPIILGVKEIPPALFEPSRTYVFFSHTIKGQPENMPALRRIMDLDCTLIDYEKIVNGNGQRLVFFGRFAGIAGMIDSLWALGRRLEHEGIDSPFQQIEPAHRYRDLAHVRESFHKITDEISTNGLPEVLTPFVCGFAGYGQVSQGAQEIYDLLPMKEVQPSELAELPVDKHACYKVVFKEEHLVQRTDATQPFELLEYYQQPDKYQADFIQYVPHLSMLINCIYWEPRYPRLITQEQFQQLYENNSPRLRVIGDITCDIDGSLACTTRSTTPDSPIYVYDPVNGTTADGVIGHGPVVQAVDFLPCEVPVDASRSFSEALKPFIPALASADFSSTLDQSGLPPELAGAVIVYRGELTESYRYLQEFLP